MHRPWPIHFLFDNFYLSKKSFQKTLGNEQSACAKTVYKCPGLSNGRHFRTELGKWLSRSGQSVNPVCMILSKCNPQKIAVKILFLHIILFLYSSFPCLVTCVVKSRLLYLLGTAQHTLIYTLLRSAMNKAEWLLSVVKPR